MIQGKCPICAQPYQIGTLAELPTFPFCSQRCRLVDLGRWIDGAYVVPPAAPSGSDEPEDDSEPLDDDEAP
jgi:endogenous inhibitor of DNA gyrase (YacG/DUF329 family)